MSRNFVNESKQTTSKKGATQLIVSRKTLQIQAVILYYSLNQNIKLALQIKGYSFYLSKEIYSDLAYALKILLNSKTKSHYNIRKKKMVSQCFLILLLPVISLAWSYNTTQPTWITSPYFRAGHQAVISTLTGNTSTPTYTFTFSSALSGVPNLAYGIKNYRGNDTLLNECFEIRRVNLNSTNFRVSIQIFGFTNVWILDVPYIAVDPSFPHHLNTFDNVALNYSSGPLTNFSSQSSTQVFHTEVINYNSQAAALTYKNFQLPLTSNKIVLYITSLYIFGSGTSGGGSSNKFPVNLTISYSILNTTHYQWTANFGINATVTSLRFSQIIYNQDDVQGSRLYQIIYDFWQVGAAGQWQPFPQQLIDNMIVGLQDFQTIDGACGFEYQWEYINQSSVFGIKVLPSLPLVAYCGFSLARSNVFYIKTWKCSPPYDYFNQTDSLCQTACGDYYIENNTLKVCDTCYYSCQQCTVSNSQQDCSVCDSYLNRSLVNGSCQCDPGFYDNGYESTCRSCQVVVNNCATCSYSLDSSKPSSYYQTIFSSGSWATDILTNFTCIECTSPYYLSSSSTCSLCTLSNCLTCQNSTACQTCNSSANATLSSTFLCILCDVDYCATCSSDDFCSVCDSGYNVINGSCLLCNQSCTCDGWVSPMISGVCSTLCGDGTTRGVQQCDDNNTDSNDGCSSACITEYCGDGTIQTLQQCDDGNTADGDGCSFNCTIQIIVETSGLFIPTIYSQYAGYALFILGFKIVGMQMLAVIQNFQLILKSNDDKYFQIDLSSHGYINQSKFFLKIESSTHVLTYFNYMFLAILLVFMIGIVLQFLSLLSSKNNRKISNSNRDLIEGKDKRKDTFHTDVQSEISSQVSDDFVVHCKKKKKQIQQIDTHQNLSKISNNSSQFSSQNDRNLLYKLANIVLKQILMNLIINQLYIFTYGLSLQFNTTQFQYFFNLPTILIFTLYVFAFIAIFWYLTSEDVGFGQNQLKLKKGSWLHYWFTVTAQRLVLGAILGGHFLYGIWLVLIVKVLFIFYYIGMNFYQKKSQFRRSLLTHGLHLTLIIAYLFNIKYFRGSSLEQEMPSNIMQYIQIAILILVILIAVGYLIKQVIYECQADFRRQEQNQECQIEKCKKLDQISQDSINSFNLSQPIAKKRKYNPNLEVDNEPINGNVPQISKRLRQNAQIRGPNLKKTFQRHKRAKPFGQQKDQNAFQQDKDKIYIQQSKNYKHMVPSINNITHQNQPYLQQSPNIRPQQKVMNDQYKEYFNRNNNSRYRRKGFGQNNNANTYQDTHNQSQNSQKPFGDRMNRQNNSLNKQKSSFLSHGLIKNEKPTNLSNMYANHLKNQNTKRSHINIVNTHRSDQSQQFDDKVSIVNNLK